MDRSLTLPRAIVIAGPNGAGNAELHRRLDLAMTRAFYAAVRLHRMHGLPLAVWKDGGVRHVDARDIRLPDDDATCRAQRADRR